MDLLNYWRILAGLIPVLVLAIFVLILFRSRPLKIFINYRKDDTDDPVFRRQFETSREARDITEALRTKLGDQHKQMKNGHPGPVREGEVFLDCDDIPPGADWRQYIKTQHHQSSVLVCLIGKQWQSLKVGDELRLFRTGDIVREELEAAFQQGMEVIPVLVNGAGLAIDNLPDGLTQYGFQHLNWMKLNTTTGDFPQKVDDLVGSIRRHVRKKNQEERWAGIIDVVRLSAVPLVVWWTILAVIPDKLNAVVFAVLAVLMFVLALPVFGSWSILKLVHDTRCREPDFSWYAAYCELAYCYLRSLGRRSVERVARVRIEAAVVHAHPEEPVPDDDPERRRREQIQYRQARKNRQSDLNKAAA
ncbi:MAG TPA: TIR domain-containing protein, partial [Planctomycetaceae bacterium]|nr:TIR domain-containing protein [Planctomycetaceae bacterium]